ncbi:hypothetical protein F511_39376 [Dorcoceras hygrometricum]|uniref:Uncharacterized protein n=1 Tax=Dorcoceras hygrometricum TaxID=472368 RepID=A0A2Z7A8I7_9LAMI|nr:hypothetical protein F511_39376 [Dorcoceras hygrometricum]
MTPRRRGRALDSSRESLSFHTTFGGCGWLVEECEVAARVHCFVSCITVVDGSGSSSSSGSQTEFCGFCGGKHPSTQCVGVQGSCCETWICNQELIVGMYRFLEISGGLDLCFQLLRDVFKEDLVFDFEHQIPYLANIFPECSSLRTLGKPGFIAGRGFNPAGGAPGGG